ncbi:MAG: putative membrane protein [Candidatus Methanohalarchaeum thermophilum]|uniref:Membrane protein n=1 Tax=Methanohalarchaeum thermophilum TaxID=1903181 RepID=A0A1Q6DXH9_METT1|nr:MAG: putative membrane protein [Candidatus Methanohalarchaeum thermophilum]
MTNKVNLINCFKKTKDIYVDRFWDLIPFFILISSISVLIQVLFFTCLQFIINDLRASSKLSELINLVNTGEITRSYNLIVQDPNVVLVTSVFILLSFLILLISISALYPGLIYMVGGLVNNRDKTLYYGLKGIRKNFWNILKLNVFLSLFTGFLFFISIFSLNLSLLFRVFISLVNLLVLILAYVFIFLFSYETIVLNKLNLLEGLHKSFNYARKNFIVTISYIIVSILIFILSAIISTVFSSTISSGVLNLLQIFIVLPFLSISKVLIYLAAENEIKTQETYLDFKSIIKKILKNTKKTLLFSKRHIQFVLISFLPLIAGILYGLNQKEWFKEINLPLGEIAQLNFLDFINITLHNWIVAFRTAFSGIFLGIPPIGSLFYNGYIIGLARLLTEDLRTLLLGILPHGVIELPALAIAGAIGIKIGIDSIKLITKKITLKKFSSNLKKYLKIITGLLPLFILAGFIEIFITPLFMSL